VTVLTLRLNQSKPSVCRSESHRLGVRKAELGLADILLFALIVTDVIENDTQNVKIQFVCGDFRHGNLTKKLSYWIWFQPLLDILFFYLKCNNLVDVRLSVSRLYSKIHQLNFIRSFETLFRVFYFIDAI